MRLLLDTNIFLDLPQRRTGVEASQAVINLLGRVHEGFVAWHTLSNVFYIAGRLSNARTARDLVHDILTWCEVASVSHEDAVKAEAMSMEDFEDALQIAAALSAKADWIITRDFDDYASSAVPAIAPENFLRLHHPDLLF